MTPQEVDTEALKEEVLYSVLQFFGDECDAPFDATGRERLRDLLSRTLWRSIDRAELVWDPDTQRYVKKWVREIARNMCKQIDEDRGEKIDGDMLFSMAHPVIVKAKKKADVALARLADSKAKDSPDHDETMLGLLKIWTKYCDDYPE